MLILLNLLLSKIVKIARLDFRPVYVAHNFEPDQGVIRWKSVCIEILRGPKEKYN